MTFPAYIDAAPPRLEFSCPGPDDLATPNRTLDRTDAAHLTALLALHEQRSVIGSGLDGIKPFDPWCLEPGKTLAARIAQALTGHVFTHLCAEATARLDFLRSHTV